MSAHDFSKLTKFTFKCIDKTETFYVFAFKKNEFLKTLVEISNNNVEMSTNKTSDQITLGIISSYDILHKLNLESIESIVRVNDNANLLDYINKIIDNDNNNALKFVDILINLNFNVHASYLMIKNKIKSCNNLTLLSGYFKAKRKKMSGDKFEYCLRDSSFSSNENVLEIGYDSFGNAVKIDTQYNIYLYKSKFSMFELLPLTIKSSTRENDKVVFKITVHDKKKWLCNDGKISYLSMIFVREKNN